MHMLMEIISELAGLLVLLAIAGVGLIIVLTVITVRVMARPPRRTVGYALAHGLPTEPSDLGLAFETIEIERPDGARLEAWVIEDGGKGTGDVDGGGEAAGDESATRGTRRTAICLHGWGQSKIDVLARLPVYRGLFDRLVLIDMRGHGESGGLCSLGEREVDDLLAVLERFALRGEATAILGWSMGAIVGLEAARRWRAEHADGPALGLLCIGGYTSFGRALRARMRRAGYPAEPMASLALWWIRLMGRRPLEASVELIRAMGDGLNGQSSDAALFIWAQGSEDGLGLTDEERAAVTGEASPSGANDASAASAGPEVIVIDGAAHLDLEYVDPARMRELAEGLISRLEGL